MSALELVERINARRQADVAKQPPTPDPPLFLLDHDGELAFKDDMATMEAAIFSLSTREDLKVWKWSSVDGKKNVEVAPSVYGRATMHDKDVLIYLTSHLVAAGKDGKKLSRTVRFTAFNFLQTTNRGTRGDDYTRLRSALDRLSGTRIKTDIKAGGHRVTEAFGLIDNWSIVEKSEEESRMVAVEVTLSKWLYSAILEKDVLTINPKYFRLRKPLERRLYSIARKHVGKQGKWEIGIKALREKCGSSVSRLRQFRGDLQKIIEADNLPDFRLIVSENKVKFYSRDVFQVLSACG